MYLKKIEMKGFKSFPDRVSLHFDRGIATIVGPNGSGKSNIADGVRWVLGEQSIKALRGNRMEDVIFSGTDSRKALGFAEVSVTLDNGDGFLPIEYSEVEVTRRVYRSGESEYYLNKTGCRLRDINELFMDTGIGKEGYSIIGQGRIDEILSSKAEDRRKIFEEAAGIVKYKTRKEEAERKLLRTEENLLRLEDIIEELQRQIGPLTHQCEIAKIYMNTRSELKDLELSMFVKSIETLDRQRDAVTVRIKERQGVIDDKTVFINKLDEEKFVLENKTVQVEENLRLIQEKMFENLKLKEKKEGELNVLKQKVIGERESIDMHMKELKRIEADSERAKDEKQSKGCEVQNLERQLEDKKEAVDAFQTNLDEMETGIIKEGEIIEDFKVDIIENLNIISEQNSKKNSLKTLNETIYKRRLQLTEEINTAIARTEELKNESSSLRCDFDTLTGDLDNGTNRRDALRIELNSLSDRQENLENKQRQLRDTLGHSNSKLNLLKQMEKEYEGYSRSVRALITVYNKNGPRSSGIIGPIAGLIKVNAGMEKAIETALGYSLQSIATNTEEDAKEAIEFLKQKRLGRATFLPVSSIKPRQLSKKEEYALQGEGCLGRASALVTYPAKIRGIINNLLGRVVVVNSLNNGIKMAKAFEYAFKIVTVDGDVINAGGSITGGSSQNKDSGLLQRKREIAILTDAITEEEKLLKELNGLLERLYYDRKKIECELENTVKNLHASELKKTKLAEMLERTVREISEKETKCLRLKAEKSELEYDYNETRKEIDETDKYIRKKESENRGIQRTIKELQTINLEKKQDRENIKQQMTVHRIEAAKTGQRLENTKEGYRRAVSELEKLQASILERKEIIKLNEGNIKRLLEDISSIKINIENIVYMNNKDVSERVKLEQQRTQYYQEIKEKEKTGKEAARELSELEKKLHRDELSLTRVVMELNGLHDRMWEDYEITYIQALDLRGKTCNEKEARNRILELKTKLKCMGNVNLNAIEEHKRVKERLDFLSTQKVDLENAKAALNKIIDEMLNIMKKQFKEQFSVINESFGSVFKELFGGGKAQVLLSEDEDVLSSGIEIIAQPPGKKLQHLSLLSGGEKALTAIALLFAILSVRPSPFCILDEIESSLDDANVERFGIFLKELASDIQFVVITHRKGTMEVADSLYGVTMEEKGISKLISIKLEGMVS